MKTVSVIIPTYNRAQKVCRAIASVLYQSFSDYEILVVDDGSRDGTGVRLTPFRSCITLFAQERNLGVSSARNVGIRNSRSPLVAFLDSDDYWLPEKLASQVEFMRQHPEAAACQTEETWIRKGLRANPRKMHLKPSGDIFEASLRLCLVSPSAVMIRRAILEEVGLFDEGFPVCEDYDLWLRISCRYPIHLITKALVVKEGGAADQLSAAYQGMDRLRILSMLRLIEQGRLNRAQRDAALREIDLKSRIYGAGCLKRGKLVEGEFFIGIPKAVEGFLHEGREIGSLLRSQWFT